MKLNFCGLFAVLILCHFPIFGTCVVTGKYRCTKDSDCCNDNNKCYQGKCCLRPYFRGIFEYKCKNSDECCAGDYCSPSVTDPTGPAYCSEGCAKEDHPCINDSSCCTGLVCKKKKNSSEKRCRKSQLSHHEKLSSYRTLAAGISNTTGVPKNVTIIAPW